MLGTQSDRTQKTHLLRTPDIKYEALNNLISQIFISSHYTSKAFVLE